MEDNPQSHGEKKEKENTRSREQTQTLKKNDGKNYRQRE